jgi:hypothetical protein
MSLLTFAQARPWAKASREAVLSRQMPPWHADPRFGDFANDRRLTDPEIATIKNWVDGDALPGEPKDLPPAPHFANGWRIGEPDAVIPIPAEQVVKVKSPDAYLYFTVPTNFQTGCLGDSSGAPARKPPRCASRARVPAPAGQAQSGGSA